MCSTQHSKHAQLCAAARGYGTAAGPGGPVYLSSSFHCIPSDARLNFILLGFFPHYVKSRVCLTLHSDCYIRHKNGLSARSLEQGTSEMAMHV
jgi:hypothetical protein